MEFSQRGERDARILAIPCQVRRHVFTLFRHINAVSSSTIIVRYEFASVAEESLVRRRRGRAGQHSVWWAESDAKRAERHKHCVYSE